MVNGIARCRLLLVVIMINGAAFSDAACAEIKIAASIAPVHSLVSMVTKDVAEPALIIRPGASPHGYAMKPSEARALDQADVVFWVGRSLEFWMEKAIHTLAADAEVIELAAAEGALRLGLRGGGAWEKPDDHDHDEPAESGNAHDPTGYDPHLWLDPDNAIVWVRIIATELSSLDPENGRIYKANAAAAEGRLMDMASAMRKDLEAVRSKPYIVFHDAYQYLERYFGLNAVGAISLSDADRPSAARLLKIQERIEQSGATCAFTEPQFEPKLLETVIQGQQVEKGVLDPMGADLERGADLYPTLMTRLAASLTDCLSQ